MSIDPGCLYGRGINVFFFWKRVNNYWATSSWLGSGDLFLGVSPGVFWCNENVERARSGLIYLSLACIFYASATGEGWLFLAVNFTLTINTGWGEVCSCRAWVPSLCLLFPFILFAIRSRTLSLEEVSFHGLHFSLPEWNTLFNFNSWQVLKRSSTTSFHSDQQNVFLAEFACSELWSPELGASSLEYKQKFEGLSKQ